MKKSKRVISLLTTAAIIAGMQGAAVIPAGASSISDIVQVPMDYFDSADGWRDASGTSAAMPKSVMGSIDTTKCSADTRRWGGNPNDKISAAKDEDDSYLWFETLSTNTGNADTYFELISYRAPFFSPFNRVLLEEGRTITLSMDIATSNIASGAKREFVNTETNADVKQNASNKWQTIVSAGTDGKLGSATLESNKWYNLVCEINGQNVTYYIDGEDAGTANLTGQYLGLIRFGFKANGRVEDIALDNYSLRVDEPYTQERYLADKTAKALSFKHIKGENTDKNEITSKLNLLDALPGYEDGTVITWRSSDADVISEEGVVTQDAYNHDIVLTATVTNGDKTAVKDFAVKVLGVSSAADKSVLSSLLTAQNSVNREKFSEASWTVYSEALAAGEAVMNDANAAQDVIDSCCMNITAAAAALTYKGSESAGIVTKDAFAHKGSAGTNHGADAVLAAKYPSTEASQGTARRIFAGFDISGISEDAGKVLLRLYVSQMGSNTTYADTMYIHSVGNGWSESGLTWNNMPKDYSQKPLAQHGPENIHPDNTATKDNVRYIDFDVTDYVMEQKKQGATEVSFAVCGTSSGSGMIYISSKEGVHAPLLTAEKTLKSAALADLEALSLPSEVLSEEPLELPVSGSKNESVISWESSDTDVIAADGTVKLPERDANVTLTATVEIAGLSYTRSFELYVKRLTSDEEEINELTFDVIRGANAIEEDVVYDLTLADKGAFGTPIVWASSDESVIGTDGKVVREALADAKDVTLTATIGTAEKVFNLRVPGDYYVMDNCVDMEHVVYATNDLRVTTETTWRVTGMAHSANGKTGQYVVYKACEGADFTVETAVNGVGSLRMTFFTSADNENWTPFTAIKEDTERMPVGEFGGLSKLIYTSTSALPEGTRYLKAVIPDVNRAWRHYLCGVAIKTAQNEPKFDDIKLNNTAADIIVGNINLVGEYDGASAEWSSNSEYIAADGTFTLPAEDTDVALTAVINDGTGVTTKVYNLVAKTLEKSVKALDRPFAWYISKNQIAGIRADSGFVSTDTIYTSCDVVNLTGEDKNVVLGLAVYDEAMVLVDVAYEVRTVKGDTPAAQHLEAELKLTEGSNYAKSTVKSFIWDDSETPLYEPLNVTRTK